ncbi:MAG: hypothetical protein HPY90_12655 [Syntrophothermus sp.]|uniref:hypothetical protein n=1 Tax=Syntrophothermus sp. TaxID=2736299 RepID=UPI0025806DE0|nr:hypothetical protein [Syntrophothermus sp.]NSW84099.1 hypothetical protein [Syntrophothermus sp.]
MSAHNMMQKVKVIKHEGTWNDRPAISVNYLLGKSRIGLRVNVMKWLDTGETEIRLIEGDGRNADFKVHKTLKIQTHDQQAVDAVLKEWFLEVF